MKGWHCKTELQQEHRRKAENHQNKLPTLIHTHTHSSACQTPDIYIRRGRTQWACGGIEGWGGEVGHAIGGCKHCKTVSPWKPAHCSEASHSPSIQSTAPPKSFQSQVPWPTGPRIGPSPRLPAWLSSTADVHRGVALDDWIPWALQRGRGRKDEDSGLDRGLMRPRSCVCGDLIFTVTVQVHTDESVDVHVSWCAFSPCAICRVCSNYLFLVK